MRGPSSPGRIPAAGRRARRSATRAFSSAPPAPATPGHDRRPAGTGLAQRRLAGVCRVCRPTASCSSASRRATARGLGGRSTTRCVASCPTPAASPSAPAWLDTLSLAPTGPRLARSRASTSRSPPGRAEGARGPAPAVRRDRRPARRRSPAPSRCRRRCAPSTATPRDSGRRSSATATSACLRGRASGPIPARLLPLPFAARLRVDTALGHASRRSSGADTARARWPLQVALLDSLPLVAELDDDTTQARPPDSLTVGRAVPGGTYDWFFPDRHARRGDAAGGTAISASGSRARPRPGSPSAEARPLAPGGPAPSAVVGSVTRHADAGPGHACAFRSASACRSGSTRPTRRSSSRFYGAAGDVDWMRYGAGRHAGAPDELAAGAADEVALDFELEPAGLGLPRALGSQRPAARHPPAPGDRRGRSAPRPAHRGGPRPSARRRHRAHRAARGRGQPGRRARAAAPARGGGREGAHDPHRPTARSISGPGCSWPSRPTPTCWSRSTTTRCPTGSIRSSTTAPASTTTSPAASRSRARSRPRSLRRLGLRDLGIGRGDLALVRGDLDALGADRGTLHDAAGPGGGAALGRGAAAATPRPCWTGSASILRTCAASRREACAGVVRGRVARRLLERIRPPPPVRPAGGGPSGSPA